MHDPPPPPSGLTVIGALLQLDQSVLFFADDPFKVHAEQPATFSESERSVNYEYSIRQNNSGNI